MSRNDRSEPGKGKLTRVYAMAPTSDNSVETFYKIDEDFAVSGYLVVKIPRDFNQPDAERILRGLADDLAKEDAEFFAPTSDPAWEKAEYAVRCAIADQVAEGAPAQSRVRENCLLRTTT